jgi:asparagine synthase (glutamine-hydrolysing)
LDRKAAKLSGIAGIFHRNGAPVERALLQSFADFLFYRGPDFRGMWMDGSIGLAYTLLQTTNESLGEKQPASLEERYWIVTDARLDSRDELINELQRSRRKIRPNAPDSELIVHAYAAWGTPCVDHLRGDFSFALWDAGHKQLFCARDHFGIKPFYYAQLGELFLFSNTLNCLRQHPVVSSELNDAAIGDFLLFGLNYDNTTTSFRDIQRLPPAHTLTVSQRGLQIRRYWTPPTDGRIRYARPEDYVENFQSIFEVAVAERLRTGRVGIRLSGGLDSSSVAAVASEISKKRPIDTELRGYTYIYKSLIPDQEEEYTQEVGRFLRIPIKFMPLDEAQLFERWDDPKVIGPEPIEDPFFARILDTHRDISADCRVLLSGEGGDDLMDFQMWSYVGDLRRRGEWRQLLTDVANYLWVRPFPWRGLRVRALRLLGKDPDQPVYPQWLAPEFKRRENLEERWKEGGRPKSWPVHPIHPRAYASMASPLWTHLFEQDDPGATGCLIETLHPFLDLRLVNFLLAMPPFPWFFRKTLLREAMTGRLPERIRTRPKTPLQGDPVSAQIKLRGAEHLKLLPWSPELDRYIDRAMMIAPHAKMDQEQASGCLRPYCLNIWLQSAHRIRYNIHAEASNG